jgi:GAF domain-containing protein
VSRSGWQKLLQHKKEVGYISTGGSVVTPLLSDADPEYYKAVQTSKPVLSKDQSILYMPILVRAQAIGALRLGKSESGQTWTDEDIQTASIITEQVGTALESARLYADISERAERESAISDITAKIGASVDLDMILRTAVGELGNALGDTEVILQLGGNAGKGKQRD